MTRNRRRFLLVGDFPPKVLGTLRVHNGTADSVHQAYACGAVIVGAPEEARIIGKLVGLVRREVV